jgi:dGTP triphosphohydrolase
MALEDDIRRLTEAVQELTAQMRQQTGNPVPVFTDNLEPLPREEAPAPAKAKPAKAKAEEAAPAKLDYVQLIQTPALTLVKAKGRDALAGILAEFGAKTAKDITEDQWPALAARIAEASA